MLIGHCFALFMNGWLLLVAALKRTLLKINYQYKEASYKV